MSAQRPGVITADIRASEIMDRLVITPRQTSDYHTLSGILTEALPGIKVNRSASGLWIAARYADALLEAQEVANFRWSEEARVFATNRRRARLVHQRLYIEVDRIRSGGRGVGETYLADVNGLDVLDDHQLVNVAAMTLPEGYGLCVFDEQGAGKTVTLIFAYDVLVTRDQVDFALIVAPKSMVSEWPRDFGRFKGDLYKVEIMSGTRREKRSALKSDADMLVTNFETAVSMEQELRALLRRYQGRAMLTIDESFFTKNLDTKRTRAVRRLREWCGRAFVLCGTPAPNSPHDLVQQFNIVDFGVTFDGVAIPDERVAARPVVRETIQERGLYVRHLKQEVLPELPGKTFHRVLLPFQPQQERLYRGALENLIEDLRQVDEERFRRELGSFLAKRMALLQICSNPVTVADWYQEVPAKLIALDAILEDLIERREEKVVVWSYFRGALDAINSRYARFNPVRYDGTVQLVEDRREAVRRFQEDSETMLFVGNPAAAGAGLTLHRARYAVYESLSNQAAHYLQSVDRIHRRGQEREVEYLILLCEGSIEVEDYDRLTEKERAAQDLLGDEVDPPVTRQVMLDEALRALHCLGIDDR